MLFLCFLMIWPSCSFGASSSGYTWVVFTGDDSVQEDISKTEIELSQDQVDKVYNRIEERFRLAYNQSDASVKRSSVGTVVGAMLAKGIAQWVRSCIGVKESQTMRTFMYQQKEVSNIRREVVRARILPGIEQCDIDFFCTEYRAVYLRTLQSILVPTVMSAFSCGRDWVIIEDNPLEFLRINATKRLAVSSIERSIWRLIDKEVDIALIRTLFGADIC